MGCGGCIIGANTTIGACPALPAINVTTFDGPAVMSNVTYMRPIREATGPSNYTAYIGANCYVGYGATAALYTTVPIFPTAGECVAFCDLHESCSAVTYGTEGGQCWQYEGCRNSAEFAAGGSCNGGPCFNVYVKPTVP